jgi:hypothetical protein
MSDTEMLTYVLDVLEFAENNSIEFEIDWSVVRRDRSIVFWYRCNDTYFWGTADSEAIEPRDMESIRALADEVAAMLPGESMYLTVSYALLIWCSRKRGMRPQGCAYPPYKALWPLLDACGPERESGIGCSNKRPEGEV